MMHRRGLLVVTYRPVGTSTLVARSTGGFPVRGESKPRPSLRVQKSYFRKVKTNMIRKEDKTAVIEANRTHATDTGSPEVQVAILTARIKELTEHMKSHQKDFHTRRGLLMLVGRRRRLLSYIKKNDIVEYRELIKALGIRDNIQ